MPKILFIITAALYWVSFLGRLSLWFKSNPRLDRFSSLTERLSLFVFTAALVVYIAELEITGGEVHSAIYDRPVSFLLFAWAIAAAHLTSEIIYGNRATAPFANLWAALALTLSATATALFSSIFTSDLAWLSFHRLCFLLGYAFCMLALPLVVRYLTLRARAPKLQQEFRAEAERELWRLDRMAYRMVLWALPLLTAGIIAEALVLLEQHQLPGPAELWSGQRETMLALTTWFLCGIYLHSRLFFGWRNTNAATLYLVGLALLLAGHFSQILFVAA